MIKEISKLIMAVFAVQRLFLMQAHGQEMEPRAYSLSPVGTNFIAAVYSYSSGDVLLDPTLPITDVSAKINAVTYGGVRSFAIGHHLASIGLGIPYLDGKIEGMIGDQPGETTRIGYGDARLRLVIDFLEGSAVSREEFLKKSRRQVLGLV